MWTDEQLREHVGGTSNGGKPMDTDAATVDATAQEAAEQGGPGVWKCQQCGTSNSFCHRPGPGGMGTLCNSASVEGACGEGSIGREVSGGIGGEEVWNGWWRASQSAPFVWPCNRQPRGMDGCYLEDSPSHGIGADGCFQSLHPCVPPLRLSFVGGF